MKRYGNLWTDHFVKEQLRVSKYLRYVDDFALFAVEFAYKFGCAAIRLASIPEQLTPTLKKKPFNGSKDQPLVPSELASELDQELNDSGREVLTELLIRSRRAEYSARKALCIKIGIEPNQLGFLRQSTDADLALKLISYLYSIGNKQALCKI